jgi:urease accessory protein UreF
VENRRCAYCDAVIDVSEHRRGPLPRYCSDAHRQRAYERRRRDRDRGEADDELIMLRNENRALRNRNDRLWTEIIDLRQQLHDLAVEQDSAPSPPTADPDDEPIKPGKLARLRRH